MRRERWQAERRAAYDRWKPGDRARVGSIRGKPRGVIDTMTPDTLSVKVRFDMKTNGTHWCTATPTELIAVED